jgi:CheY-like chemotaxis protein
MTSAPRILVVEDDTAIRETIAELLEDEGFEVECAANGADALARLDASATPAVILLDLQMPVMDGWAFRETQRRDPRYATIPTVVVTASYGTDPKAAAAELAPAGFLAKPFDLDRLLSTIRAFC